MSTARRIVAVVAVAVLVGVLLRSPDAAAASAQWLWCPPGGPQTTGTLSGDAADGVVHFSGTVTPCVMPEAQDTFAIGYYHFDESTFMHWTSGWLMHYESGQTSFDLTAPAEFGTSPNQYSVMGICVINHPTGRLACLRVARDGTGHLSVTPTSVTDWVVDTGVIFRYQGDPCDPNCPTCWTAEPGGGV